MTPREREAAELEAVEGLRVARAGALAVGLDTEERRRRRLALTRARNNLALLALGFVFHAARRAARGARSLEEGDLVAEGLLAALRCVDRHDPTRGPFVTFAAPWIRRAMSRALADLDDVVRVPVNVASEVRRVERVRARFVQAHGRDPEVRELAASTGLSASKVERLAALPSRAPASLDAPRDEEGHAWVELLAGDDPGPEALVAQAERAERVRVLLAGVPWRERRVLEARAAGAMLEGAGRLLSVTRQRAHQLEKSGLERLRRAGHARALEL